MLRQHRNRPEPEPAHGPVGEQDRGHRHVTDDLATERRHERVAQGPGSAQRRHDELLRVSRVRCIAKGRHRHRRDSRRIGRGFRSDRDTQHDPTIYAAAGCMSM